MPKKIQLTQKEGEVLDRIGIHMPKILQNPKHSIGMRIEELARENPNGMALFFEDDSWTWKEFNEESNKIANYFLKLGFQPKDTIAMMMDNSPEYLHVITGVNKIQGITALINTHQRGQALTHVFKIAEPKRILVDGASLNAFNEIFDTLSLRNDQVLVVNNPNNILHYYIDFETEIQSMSNTNPPTTNNSILKETYLYLYTSGTTGLPKAVITEGFRLFSQCYLLGLAVAQVTSEDIFYNPMPLYHVVPIGISWMTSIIAGAATALRKHFSASEFWKDIRKFKATFMMYVGEIPRYILNQPYSRYEENHTLKKMLGLGLRKDIWIKFKERFKIEHIFEFYGLTEGHRSFYNVDEVPGMIGRYNRHYFALAKVDPDTGEFYKNERGFCIECEPGDVGMSLVPINRTTFFTGYKNKDKTSEKLMEGVFKKNDKYFKTGDIMRMNEDYWISFVDRLGDTFRWKGENVSTLEVEEIINKHPSIQLSTVYGVEIPNTEGKAGMAAIKLNPSIQFELESFSTFVTQVLPSYSIPYFLRIVDDLKTTGSHKIQKGELRKEGYNMGIINNPLYFWEPSVKKYIQLDFPLYQNIKSGMKKL